MGIFVLRGRKSSELHLINIHKLPVKPAGNLKLLISMHGFAFVDGKQRYQLGKFVSVIWKVDD